MAKIKHIALATQNAEKTATFYKEVFGLEEVGKIDGDNAEGFYLSDGHINLAILNFKNPAVAGDEFGTEYSGIHHIGFEVEDTVETDAKLRALDSRPREEINQALHSAAGRTHEGRNVEFKYNGPDGVMIDISQGGWVGTGSD